jgi:outer membrane biosynthesis protein TonB
MDPALVQEEEETIYIVRKTEEPVQEIRQESLIQITGGSIWKREVQEVQEEEEEVQEEEVQEEEVQEEEVPVKEEKKEEVQVKKQEEPVKQEEKQEEPVEEEEGMELEVITFQGVSYYKDEEGFIYSIDEDEQPSEKAIGYWKKKAQAIAFYRSE